MAVLIRLKAGHDLTDAESIDLAMPIRRMNLALYGDSASKETSRSWAANSRLSKYVNEGIVAMEMEELQQGSG